MKQRICFVGNDNYPILNVAMRHSYIGGESVQQNLLAQAFYHYGFEVNMVVKDHGQPDGEIRNNIKIWKTFKENDGIPIYRFIYPRLTSVINALKRADADIYYQSCAGMLTGLVAWFCLRYNRKFIFRTAHDTDCMRNKQLIKFWRDKKLYEYGLKRADIIAVQGIKQQKLLEENYCLKSVPVNMIVEIPSKYESQNKDIDILWVNNIRRFKRPELAIEIAKEFSQVRLKMIGGPCAGLISYYNKIEKEAKKIKNIDFVGPVHYSKVNSYFNRAKLFINTSDIEGFPNSFLQAWIRGVPVVSFFDPDKLIDKYELGYAPSNLEGMKKCVDRLLKDDRKRLELGDKGRQFTIENYSSGVVVKKYIALLERLKY